MCFRHVVFGGFGGLCCFDLSFWKWPWFVSFCCHVLCSLGRRFVSCDIVDVYSILLWCVSVILSGLLLLSSFLSHFWCTLISVIVVFCGRCGMGCIGHGFREFG